MASQMTTPTHHVMLSSHWQWYCCGYLADKDVGGNLGAWNLPWMLSTISFLLENSKNYLHFLMISKIMHKHRIPGHFFSPCMWPGYKASWSASCSSCWQHSVITNAPLHGMYILCSTLGQNSPVEYPLWAAAMIGPFVYILAVAHAALWKQISSIVGSVVSFTDLW